MLMGALLLSQTFGLHRVRPSAAAGLQAAPLSVQAAAPAPDRARSCGKARAIDAPSSSRDSLEHEESLVVASRPAGSVPVRRSC
jgi:hypothetical protein